MNSVLRDQLVDLRQKILISKGMLEVYEGTIQYLQEQIRAHHEMKTIHYASYLINQYEHTRIILKNEKKYLQTLETLKVQLETA